MLGLISRAVSPATQGILVPDPRAAGLVGKHYVTKILVRGKNGPGGPFWSPKIGPGGPNLVAKIGAAQPKMVRCRISIEFIATKCCK